MGAPFLPLRRLLAAVAALLVGMLAVAAPGDRAAHADDPLGRAAEALQRSPLFVHPDATAGIDRSGRDGVLGRLMAATTPVYVAVLPASAGTQALGGVSQLPSALFQQVRRPGTYLVVVGDELHAGSTRIGRRAQVLADQAGSRSGGDTVTAVLDFVDRVESEAAVATTQDPPPERTATFPWTRLLLLGGTAGLVYLLVRRRREVLDRELAAVREVAAEDVAAFAADLSAFEPDEGAEAVRLHHEATEAYGRASTALLASSSPQDIEAVTTALAHGRFVLASAQAAVAGTPPPPRRPPCFFDPRHGPSRLDARWAPAGGVERWVPACADCAIRLGTGEEPETRLVPAGTGRCPYWEAGRAYGPWAGGYYRDYGGTALLPGLLVGTTLGSTLAVPEQPGPPAAESDRGGRP